MVRSHRLPHESAFELSHDLKDESGACGCGDLDLRAARDDNDGAARAAVSARHTHDLALEPVRSIIRVLSAPPSPLTEPAADGRPYLRGRILDFEMSSRESRPLGSTRQ